MITYDKNLALEFLNQDKALHAGMLYFIEKNGVDVMCTPNEGVYLKQESSRTLMLSFTNLNKGKQIMTIIPENQYLCIYLHQKELASALIERCPHRTCLPMFQGAYLSKNKIKLSTKSLLQMVKLDESYADAVFRALGGSGENTLVDAISAGLIYGGFVEGELQGIVVQEEVGNISFLDVFAKDKLKNLSVEMMAFMTNLMLDQGTMPFFRASTEDMVLNYAAFKLGYTMPPKEVYLIF